MDRRTILIATGGIVLGVAVAIGTIELLPLLRETQIRIQPPSPIVVSQTADDLSSDLLEYSVQVKSVIRNDGGAGTVVVEATVFQDGQQWTKSDTAIMQPKQTLNFRFVFEEVGMLSGGVKFRVHAYGLGSEL